MSDADLGHQTRNRGFSVSENDLFQLCVFGAVFGFIVLVLEIVVGQFYSIDGIGTLVTLLIVLHTAYRTRHRRKEPLQIVRRE